MDASWAASATDVSLVAASSASLALPLGLLDEVPDAFGDAFEVACDDDDDEPRSVDEALPSVDVEESPETVEGELQPTTSGSANHIERSPGHRGGREAPSFGCKVFGRLNAAG